MRLTGDELCQERCCHRGHSDQSQWSAEHQPSWVLNGRAAPCLQFLMARQLQGLPPSNTEGALTRPQAWAKWLLCTSNILSPQNTLQGMSARHWHRAALAQSAEPVGGERAEPGCAAPCSHMWAGYTLFLKAHFPSSSHCLNFIYLLPAANIQLNFSLSL